MVAQPLCHTSLKASNSIQFKLRKDLLVDRDKKNTECEYISVWSRTTRARSLFALTVTGNIQRHSLINCLYNNDWRIFDKVGLFFPNYEINGLLKSRQPPDVKYEYLVETGEIGVDCITFVRLRKGIKLYQELSNKNVFCSVLHPSFLML